MIRPLALALALSCAALAHAQSWPARPVKMIVPFPAGGPTDVMTRVLSDPAVRERFHALGFEITGGTPEEFTKVMQSEAARWSRVIREAHVKPE